MMIFKVNPDVKLKLKFEMKNFPAIRLRSGGFHSGNDVPLLYQHCPILMPYTDHRQLRSL